MNSDVQLVSAGFSRGKSLGKCPVGGLFGSEEELGAPPPHGLRILDFGHLTGPHFSEHGYAYGWVVHVG